ncbi:hypothetical protein F511_29006 [Dorcoceras hygrometricum]|uniref:Uncharacterized protein n=1 Tax=Dorcoceras hygrometricum TaxID=472368 RepID=A0A2Z7D7N1_9LAMI|nr:hypothetical protein F511_29006 [Dorcoceras hygrometricum]
MADAGLALAVRLSHERRPCVAPLLGVLLCDVAPLVALDGRVSTPRDGAAGRRLADATLGRRCARWAIVMRMEVRRCVALRAMVRSCRREFLWWRRRRRRPPLRESPAMS